MPDEHGDSDWMALQLVHLYVFVKPNCYLNEQLECTEATAGIHCHQQWDRAGVVDPVLGWHLIVHIPGQTRPEPRPWIATISSLGEGRCACH